MNPNHERIAQPYADHLASYVRVDLEDVLESLRMVVSHGIQPRADLRERIRERWLEIGAQLDWLDCEAKPAITPPPSDNGGQNHD